MAASPESRPATLFDLVAVRDLLRAARLPVADIAEHLGRFLVIEVAGTVVAAGGFEAHGEDVLLRSLVVSPTHRRLGIARRLTTELLAQAAAGGARRAWLLTDSATGLFAGCGFAPADRAVAPRAIRSTRQFTTLCSEAATLMTRELGPAVKAD
jgi:N-acetylglutamate synthase-like GNAT family acetyltransferase